MSTPTLTRCPDPTGAVSDSAGAVTYALTFTADGRYLAQVYQKVSAGADPMRLAVYRRDGDQLVKLAVPPLDATSQGQPRHCWWHPGGQWLIVSVLPGAGADTSNPATYPSLYRLWVYHRTGDTLTLVGSAGSSVYGDYQGGQGHGIAFDATGQWAALATADGVQGLAAFNTATGALSLVDGTVNGYGTPTVAGMVTAVAWHPTDATLLAYADAYGHLGFQRRAGQQLVAASVPAESTLPAETTTTVLWHPGGTFLLLTDFDRVNADGLLVHRYHPLTRDPVIALDQLAYATGFAINGGGQFVAGGAVYASNPNGGGCCGGGSCCGPAGGGYLGLTVTAVEPRTATGGGAVLWPTPLERPADADQVPGEYVSFADDTPGVSYLAASTASWTVPQYTTVEPWGLRLFRIDTTASSLHMKTPDGSYQLVGTTSQPLSFTMPEGSRRTWPGSQEPLYQKMPDGSWRQVFG